MPSWWDRFGEEWATGGVVDDPTTAQADAGWAFIGQAPPTVEQFNSLAQWSDDKDNWLFGQIATVISSAGLVPDPNNLGQLLAALNAKQKRLLLTDTTFYVDAINGNDSTADGSTIKPFKTIQNAYNWIMVNIEAANHVVILQLRPGTYEPFHMNRPFNGYLVLNGDKLNQRAYIVKNTNGIAIEVSQSAVLYVQGLSVEAAGSDLDYTSAGYGLAGINGGVIAYQDISFGYCSYVHMGAGTAGQVWSNGPNVNYTIYGGARIHAGSWSAGVTTNVKSNVTIQGTPNFSGAFTQATIGGYTQSWGSTFTGACTGTRALADANGIININGADPNTFFPGSAPAQTFRGGLIV